MPELTITRQIDAPVERVWEVLDDFGDIQRWSPGIIRSMLTSEGPVREGSTRYCAFKPFGAVNERIEHYETNRRMTIKLYETFKLPISEAVADFQLEPHEGGTQVTLHYSYTLNLMGRLMKGTTEQQMEKGMGGLTRGLQRACERLVAG